MRRLSSRDAFMSRVSPRGGLGVAVDFFDFGVPVDVEAPPASEIVTEEKMNAMMEKECAGASADLENKNPLCAIYGVDLSASGSRSSGSGQSRSPDRTFQPIEGK